MALRSSDNHVAAGDWVKPPSLLVSDNAEWTHSSLWLIFHLMSWLPLREMEGVIIHFTYIDLNLKNLRKRKEGKFSGLQHVVRSFPCASLLHGVYISALCPTFPLHHNNVMWNVGTVRWNKKLWYGFPHCCISNESMVEPRFLFA